MIGRTHDLAAATLLGAVILVVPIPPVTLGTALLAILANQIGGIAPDIDQPTAPLWRNLPIGGPIGKVFDKMLGGHRFLTHSLIGVALLGLAAYFLIKFLHPIMPNVNNHVIWWAFMIGVISHLIMDSFTKEGVPWLLPFPIKFGLPPIKDLRITTGKAIETLVVFPGLIAIDIWLYTSNSQHIMALVHNGLIQ
ncbi:MAG TPA: metal-dependent hydrolase [Patescibacteria group bacterium]|jgi:inner membrane protein|nr:metal-dependent hydrolase [Patescibacteria group bacterium]